MGCLDVPDDDVNVKVGRRAEAREETRNRLLEAAAVEFAAHGVQGARVQAITDRAGVAAGTLYAHFKDKDTLFEELVQSGAQLVIENFRRLRESEATQEARDLRGIESVVAFAEYYAGMFRLLLSRGSADGVAREAMDAVVENRASVLREGQEEGWVRPDLNPELAARAEVGAAYHLIDWWLANPELTSRELVVQTLHMLRRFGVEGHGGGWDG